MPAAWNVPARSVVLAGHRRLLAAVDRTLRAGEPALLLRGGGGGAGATTAMIEFAHRRARDYDVAWWVRAADPDLVPDGMAALAEALGLAAPTDDAEAATARLLGALRHRERYLLVFADAENPRQLARFLPAGRGHAVIVSADPRWEAHATAHVVEPFTRAESVALLRCRRPDLPVDDAAAVAAALDDLPLAVDPAAALLADTGMDAERLLRLLAGRSPGHPAAALWTVAFERLAADNPAALALLTLVAWLGPGPVPLRLVGEHRDGLPAALVDTTASSAVLAERLRECGLARVTPDGIQLHPVPAALLVARTAHEHVGAGSDGWAAVAVRLLGGALPGDPSDDPAAWWAWRRLLPLVLTATDPARPLDGVAADVSRLLDHAAGYLEVRGLRRAAETLSRDAEALR